MSKQLHTSDAKHEGISYAYDKCDHKSTQRYHLKMHVAHNTKACDTHVANAITRQHASDYKATCKRTLKLHVYAEHENSSHEVIMYSCERCDYKAKLFCIKLFLDH